MQLPPAVPKGRYFYLGEESLDASCVGLIEDGWVFLWGFQREWSLRQESATLPDYAGFECRPLSFLINLCVWNLPMGGGSQPNPTFIW